MKRIAMAVLMATSLVAAAQAGPNAGGTLTLHANTGIVYTSDATDYCGQGDLTACSEVVSELSIGSEITVFFAVAVFPSGAGPRLAGATFGIDYDDQALVLVAYGSCADFTLSTGGWPGPGEGTALTWNAALTDSLVEVYWFAGYSYSSTTTFALTPHPSQGGNFADDSVPARLDEVAGFGILGFGTDGTPACPGVGESGNDSNEGGVGAPDAPEDPQPYTFRFLDHVTHEPIAVEDVGVEESITWTYCCDPLVHDCSHGCTEIALRQYHDLTTDESGAVTVLASEAEPCHPAGGCYYEKRSSGSWSGNDRIYDEAEGGASSGWNPAIRVWGVSEDEDAIIYADRDEDLALLFLPVLHRDIAFENQEELANCEVTLSSSTLKGYKVLPGGARVYNHEEPMPPFIQEELCLYSSAMEGQDYPEQYWLVDIPDSLRHSGAPIGQRPIYYHVYSLATGLAVVQYWFWYNSNDLDDLAVGGAYSHEGDWEHVEIRLAFVNVAQGWVPQEVNFFQHECYRTYSASDCWWSATSAPQYYGLQQGYDSLHKHLHVWVAARAHASYNRYSPVIQFDDGAIYEDEVDYNVADQPRGTHAFIEYDTLINMGEYWSVPLCSAEAYYHGGPLEFMRLTANCGENIWGWTNLGGEGPKSPANRHRRWHSWESAYPQDCDSDFSHPANLHYQYLGEFSTCANSSMPERLQFRIRTPYGWHPAAATIETHGSVVFDNADGGLIGLEEIEEGGEHFYVFDEEAIHGTGHAWINVYVDYVPAYVAYNLRVDFIETCQSTADVTDDDATADAVMLATPTVVAKGETIDIRMNAGSVGGRGSVFDAGGRRVGVFDLRQDTRGWVGRWEARDVSPGLYFLRMDRGARWSTPTRVVVVGR